MDANSGRRQTSNMKALGFVLGHENSDRRVFFPCVEFRVVPQVEMSRCPGARSCMPLGILSSSVLKCPTLSLPIVVSFDYAVQVSRSPSKSGIGQEVLHGDNDAPLQSLFQTSGRTALAYVWNIAAGNLSAIRPSYPSTHDETVLMDVG